SGSARSPADGFGAAADSKGGDARSESGTPPPNASTAAEVTDKYSSAHYLNLRDHITDGFRDAGRSAARECIVVDAARDPKLCQFVNALAIKMAAVCGIDARVIELGTAVADAFGGALSDADVKSVEADVSAVTDRKSGELLLGHLLGRRG